MSLNSSITSLGAVKYNAQRDVGEHYKRKRAKHNAKTQQPLLNYDTYGYKASNMSIMPRELCLRYKIEGGGHKRMYTDTDVNVFSSANGMYINGIQKTDRAKGRIALRNKLCFGGIAVTAAECDDESAPGANKEMVVLFGGTFTMRNTGEATIKSGDWVMWDLPEPENARTWNSDQVPRDKMVFLTKPFNAMNCIDADNASAVFEAAKAVRSDYEPDNKLTPKFLKAVQDLDEAFYASRRRVFGRALSTATKGKEFDIVLGRYMA